MPSNSGVTVAFQRTLLPAIGQHSGEDQDVLKVHKAAKDMCAELQEYTYYIEVPKYTTHYSVIFCVSVLVVSFTVIPAKSARICRAVQSAFR